MAELDRFDEYINKLIYHACDGKQADIEALERLPYWGFCTTLENHLERVEALEKIYNIK